MVRLHEVYWAAGFLEGEGCFSATRNAVMITATQVQREPIDRLLQYFGGKVGRYHSATRQANGHAAIHTWTLYGAKARGVAMTLYVLMSPKRQAEIIKQLDKWKSFVGQRYRTLPPACPAGHVYTTANVYTYPDGRHGCRECARTASRLYQEKRREAARELQGIVNKKRPPATHCRKGHLLTPANTRTTKKGRECQTCRAANYQAWYARKCAKIGSQPRPARDSKTHCPHGHAYTPENTYRHITTGERICRTCQRDRMRLRRASH